ncbi:MAG: radical SAM protein [Deferribacterales bacterium]
MSLKDISSIIKTIFTSRSPKQLIVQIHDHCNATCPQCGMNKYSNFKRYSLNVNEIKNIIDKAAENGVKALSFTGGEPLLREKELFYLIKYAKSKGIKYTRTGTNGFIFLNHQKSDFDKKISILAEQIKESELYTFWISIDTWDIEKHEINRGLIGVIKGIEKGLKIFEKYGLYPSVNLGINRLIEIPSIRYYNNCTFIPEAFFNNYRLGIGKFFQFVTELGFTIANVCYPMSFEGAVYKAESSDYIVKYNDIEKLYLFKALYETIPQFRDKIRIFTPLSSLYILINQYKYNQPSAIGCRGGKDYFYIDSKGDLYPCGFLSEYNYGKDYTFKTLLQHECTECDWECFRDPSHLFHPLIAFNNNLMKLPFYYIKNNRFYKNWLSDIFYYKKSNFFNMHKPMRSIN